MYQRRSLAMHALPQEFTEILSTGMETSLDKRGEMELNTKCYIADILNHQVQGIHEASHVALDGAKRNPGLPD
jgi:hypothetical protein